MQKNTKKCKKYGIMSIDIIRAEVCIVTMKVKFTVLTVVLLFIGLVGLITGTISTVEQKVTETMVNQFTNTTMQIAGQAEIILLCRCSESMDLRCYGSDLSEWGIVWFYGCRNL